MPKLAGVTAGQFVKTGVLAVLFIVFFKWLAEKSNITGLKTFAQAV